MTPTLALTAAIRTALPDPVPNKGRAVLLIKEYVSNGVLIPAGIYTSDGTIWANPVTGTAASVPLLSELKDVRIDSVPAAGSVLAFNGTHWVPKDIGAAIENTLSATDLNISGGTF